MRGTWIFPLGLDNPLGSGWHILYTIFPLLQRAAIKGSLGYKPVPQAFQ